MFVIAPKFFLGLTLLGVICMAGGNSGASSDNKILRTRQRRAKTISLTNEDRILFLQIHNKIRKNVTKPDAGGMMKMYWSAYLEASAVSHSMKCHTGAAMREYQSQVVYLPKFTQSLAKYGSEIGHSQYSETQKPKAVDVIMFFANESKAFEYIKGERGKCKSRNDCNSYIQLVSQSTFLVGCGYASCDDFYSTTCNYLPAASEKEEPPYANGAPCTYCSSDETYKFTDCEDKLCVPADRCSPVTECTIADRDNCLCSEAEYQTIVDQMLKDAGSIHAASSVVISGLLLVLLLFILPQLVATLPGQDAQLA